MLCLGYTSATLINNYQGTFDSFPCPFTIDVDSTFEDDIKHRVSTARYVSDDLGIPAFVDGPTVSNATNIGHYWSRKYVWKEQQKRINDR